MKYRIGIDLGTNSLGWAAIQLGSELEPRQLLDLGVRIFSDARNPKDKSSNAAQRREPRGGRRNRDRKLQRSRKLLRNLIQYGLLPEHQTERKMLESQDPWSLRTRALDEPLSPHQVGRALFHLNQRRGFKSNRKTDGDNDGKVHDAIARTHDSLNLHNARTLGELFGRPRLEQMRTNESAPKGSRKPLPLARVRSRGQGAKMVYDYYPQRDMILDEFEQIWSSQAKFLPDILTSEAHDCLREIIAFQRELKKQDVGKCTYIPEYPRAPKALPSVQRKRILEEVNNLRVAATGEASRVLSSDERKILVDFLRLPSSKIGKRTFDRLRKQINLPPSQRFNLESLKRTFLQGDETAARLMQNDAFGKAWLDFDLTMQDEIVLRLLEEEDEDELIGWLQSEHGLNPDVAMRISGISLPDSYGKLSLEAIERLIPRLEAGERNDEAAAAEFGDHRALGDGEIHEDGLPYYGELLNRHTAFEKSDPKNDEERFGRVANPTVHVALNELRKVINDLIRRFGPPTQVVLELARDLPLSDRGLKDLERQQKDNQDSNDNRRKELEKLGVINNYDNRLKLRLYEELPQLNKCCIFSGKPISITDLFSSDIEIEHILPIGESLDDSFSNKVLSTREANRYKKKRSPFSAFGASIDGYDWEQVSQRATDLPPNKRWRFAPDAMDRFTDESNFLDRQLNDTRYIARLGKTFVEGLFGGQGARGQENSVWVVSGRLTSDLRHFAGFNGLLSDDNKKDRTDHRHHAIDAVVISLTDRTMVKRAADLAKREDQVAHYEIMKTMAEPLKRYRKSVEDRLAKMTVSHKPDHGFQDAMHNDTAYGITGQHDEKNQSILVTRKALDSFEKRSQLDAIRDETLRRIFVEATEGLTKSDFTHALIQEGRSQSPPVYTVRVTTPMKDTSFVVIEHGDGHKKAYKGDGNYCYDIWTDERGRWVGEVITTFQAYQKARKNPNWWRNRTGGNGQPLEMRIRKGDMLEIDDPAGRRKVMVYKFSKGKICMADHNEADASGRIRSGELMQTQMAPSSLQTVSAVQISVSPSGRIHRRNHLK